MANRKSISTKEHNKRNRKRTKRVYVQQGLSVAGLLEKLQRKTNHTFDELSKLLNSICSNKRRLQRVHHINAVARELDKYTVRLETKQNKSAHIAEHLPRLRRKVDYFYNQAEQMNSETLSRSTHMDMAEPMLRIIKEIGNFILFLLIEENRRMDTNQYYANRTLTKEHFTRGQHPMTRLSLRQGSGLARHNVKKLGAN